MLWSESWLFGCCMLALKAVSSSLGLALWRNLWIIEIGFGKGLMMTTRTMTRIYQKFTICSTFLLITKIRTSRSFNELQVFTFTFKVAWWCADQPGRCWHWLFSCRCCCFSKVQSWISSFNDSTNVIIQCNCIRPGRDKKGQWVQMAVLMMGQCWALTKTAETE